MPKRSLSMWTVDEETLRSAVETSETKAEVLEKCGSGGSRGSTHRVLRIKCREYGIDLSELEARSRAKLNGLLAPSREPRPLSEVLVEGSSYRTTHLKARLIREGLLENRCVECGHPPEWNGKPMVLILDHINGVFNDNRLENLRLLCPNCNSQMPTFAGRNSTRRRLDLDGRVCSGCGKKIARHSTSGRCHRCGVDEYSSTVGGERHHRKVENPPSKDELVEMLSSMSWSAIGRKFGVSDTAVHKWAKKHGIT